MQSLTNSTKIEKLSFDSLTAWPTTMRRKCSVCSPSVTTGVLKLKAAELSLSLVTYRRRLAYALRRRSQSDSQRQALELAVLDSRCRQSHKVVAKLEFERRPGIDKPVEYVERSLAVRLYRSCGSFPVRSATSLDRKSTPIRDNQRSARKKPCKPRLSPSSLSSS